MNPSTNIRRRLVKAIVLAAVSTAIAAPVAQAKTASPGKYRLDPWAYSLVHSREPSGRPPVVAPEITAGLAAPGSLHSSATPATASQVSQANSFDWGDAGIGAAGAFGVVLLAAGMARGLRKRGVLAHIRL
jgi:hypothetical protein